MFEKGEISNSNENSFFSHSDDDQILIQTESIGDGMIDAVEEIIDENPRPSPSAIIVLVSEYFSASTLEFRKKS